MNCLVSDLNGIDKNELTTRLLFDIATARNSGYTLAKFILTKSTGEKAEKALINALRTMKKQGRITFFVSSADFSKGSTETEYLFNKFPELKREKEDDKTIAYFIKL